MPKINVYLPDELADAVKAAELPVSAICQRALEQSVKRATAIRATVLGDLDADDPTASLTHFTHRARAALKLAITTARGGGASTVGTEHLLHGMISEGGNLALQILRTEELDPNLVLRTLDLPSGQASEASRFGADAANALELTAVEAMALGHNYVGCEHLLLGIIAEPDGAGGRVLRELGLDAKSARKAVAAALSGYAHLRAQQTQAADPAAALKAALAPIVERIERLEQRLG